MRMGNQREPRGSESEPGRGSRGRQEGRVWRYYCIGIQEFAEKLDMGIVTSGLEGGR